MGPEIPLLSVKVYLTNSYVSRAVFIRCPLGGGFSWKLEKSLYILAGFIYLVVEVPSSPQPIFKNLFSP